MKAIDLLKLVEGIELENNGKYILMVADPNGEDDTGFGVKTNIDLEK